MTKDYTAILYLYHTFRSRRAKYPMADFDPTQIMIRDCMWAMQERYANKYKAIWQPDMLELAA